MQPEVHFYVNLTKIQSGYQKQDIQMEQKKPTQFSSNNFENFLSTYVLVIFSNGKSVTYRVDLNEFQWEAPGAYSSVIEMDFRKFPFDTVAAEIELFWLDMTFHVNITSTSIIILDEIWPSDVKFMSDATTWRFATEQNVSAISTTIAKTYPITRFLFFFKRRQEYYVMTVFLPLEILMALQLATFFMPPAAIERGGYSITVNLAFAVSQQVINNQMPETSQTIYLFYYIFIYQLLGAVITVHTLMMTSVWETFDWVQKREWFVKKMFQITYGRLADITVGVLITILVIIVNIWYFSVVTTK